MGESVETECKLVAPGGWGGENEEQGLNASEIAFWGTKMFWI